MLNLHLDIPLPCSSDLLTSGMVVSTKPLCSPTQQTRRTIYRTSSCSSTSEYQQPQSTPTMFEEFYNMSLTPVSSSRSVSSSALLNSPSSTRGYPLVPSYSSPNLSIPEESFFLARSPSQSKINSTAKNSSASNLLRSATTCSLASTLNTLHNRPIVRASSNSLPETQSLTPSSKPLPPPTNPIVSAKSFHYSYQTEEPLRRTTSLNPNWSPSLPFSVQPLPCNV